ncbi:MAG: sigma-54-dependent Fis family transcriptional regulator [Pirellulales bacterium]|nr:sigma-54-dependent Fis family transcriptional regulator [Pirellulales bacterium]
MKWLQHSDAADFGPESAPELARLLAEIAVPSADAADEGAFLAPVMPQIRDTFRAQYVCVATRQPTGWSFVADAGQHVALPTDLLAEALDREATGWRGNWVAAPTAHPAAAGCVLAVHFASERAAQMAHKAVTWFAQALGRVLADGRVRRREQRRIRRLEAILEIAGRWNEAHETEALLVDMAEAATRLLRADRASIFLWDRSNHTLVARPALGVAGGELRVPDDRGVVGQVVQQGEIRRIDLSRDQEQIDRQVDSRLGYHTRTLLCVPMRSRRGETIGAFEVLNRLDGNFTPEDEEALVDLASHAAVALENTRQRERLIAARRRVTDEAAAGVRLIGLCPAIEALRSTIGRVADTDLAVLILGENGTGKEVVARSIHYLSRRRDEPFIAVNCAALTETLLESELFGHEKGAFTDAHETRRGKFELANGGTLFLDEIGDLSLAGQAKLLRVLEEKVIVRVGGSQTIATDARVIAATNQDLAEMVRQRRFREDLFYRLNVVTLGLPALAERGDDVLLLAEHFLEEFCVRARRARPQFSEAARQKLLAHRWPGNVRELRNLMERLAYLATGDTIDVADLAFILSPQGRNVALVDEGVSLAQATDAFQAEFIRGAIARSRGNMSDAANELGLHRSNLYRKMRQLGMPTSGH